MNIKDLKRYLIKYNTFIIFVILFVICCCLSPVFLSKSNLVNICQQYAATTIVSIGMLCVIVTAGIDLSVGSNVAIGSVFVSYAMHFLGWGLFPSILVAVLAGLIIGCISGVLVSYGTMAPFVATLAMMTISSGIAFIVSNGSPIMTEAGTIDVLGNYKITSFLTLLTVITAVVVLVVWFVMKYTTFGRMMFAVGSNEEAVHLAGISIQKVKIGAYAISGALAAFAGVITCSRTGIGSPSVGASMTNDCIAACVIGGASLAGGVGSAGKSVIGVLILAFISNIMNLMAIPSYPQDVIKGLIIIGAVLLQKYSSRVNY